jgi:predicted aminopeptidase
MVGLLRRLQRRPLLALAAILFAGMAVLPGCMPLSYYLQSMHGHFSVLHAARPIEDVLADPATSPELRARLRKVVDIRAFASRELALPENRSYRRYADLQRPFVVWNVFATPELSLQLRHWCFPVVGCVAYRGYYDKAEAEREAAALRQDGWEVNVGGVPAYSTLGYFDDPVLNTFIRYPEGELARLVFHELAHQIAYARDDTTFNESFATAVEEAGVERWLALPENAGLRASYAAFAQRRSDFVALLARYRRLLEENYARDVPAEDKRRGKAVLFEALRADYARMKTEQWGGFSGYDAWFARPLTNAHLAAVGTYTELVPAFRGLLQAHGGDLPSFYRAVQALAAGSRAARAAALGRYGAPAPS